MSKYYALFFLWICFAVTQSQIIPEPPIQVKFRVESMESLFDNFKKIFCTNCSEITCNQNFYQLYALPETGHFSERNISNNPDNITSVNVIKSSVNGTYSYPKGKLTNAEMGYVMYLPATKILKGLVLYNHATLFGKYDVPENSQQTPAITALYASSGFGILYPNYLGYKYFDSFPHPYVLYPTMNIQSSILALNKAEKEIKQYIPATKSLNLFSVGYSEGSAYAVLFEKCIQLPESCEGVKLNQFYHYQGAVGLDGPYDLLQTIKPFLTDRVSQLTNNTYQIQTQALTNLGKPSLLIMTLISYMYYSEGREDYYSRINTEFWRMRCAFGLDSKSCEVTGTQFQTILQALNSLKNSLEIAKAIAHSGFGRTYLDQGERYLWPELDDYLIGFHNSVFGLVSKQLMNSALFNYTIKQASATNYEPRRPLFLFSLLKDSIVSVKNTEKFVKLHNKTKVYYFENSHHKICPNHTEFNVDHAGAQLVANVFALSFIKNITALLLKQNH